MTPPCPVCGGRAARAFGTAPYRAGQLHDRQVQCAACGLVASQPQATPDALRDYYAGPYYDTMWADADALFAANRAAYDNTLWPLFKWGWSGFAPVAGASVFEVGCGYGALLAVLRDRGFRVRGVESGPRAVAFCRSHEFDVAQGESGSAQDAGAHDVAVAAYVLEHVPDPAAFVRALASLAKPGGAVVIVTDAIWTTQHVVERVVAGLRGRPSPFRTSTDHTFVFGPSHLTALLERTGCDRVRVRAFSDPPPRESWHWRAYKASCRTVDRALGLGEYLVAVGRRER